MRTASLLFGSFLLLTVSCLAGQTARVPLLNGVYSVAAPTDWHVEQAEDGSTAVFTPAEDSPASVMFIAPNPTVEGDIAEYAGIIIGLLFKSQGGGKVTNEEKMDFKGHPSILFHFAMDNGVQGIANVVDFDGYGVLEMVMAPGDQLEAFWEQAAPILDSYEFNPDAAKKNQEILDKIAADLMEELAKGLAE